MIHDAASLRVLGALMEKEMTTPDLYPLSINALVAAANQRSSRDPVLNLTEDEVRQALHGLEHAGLVTPAREGGRVARYEHRIRTVLNLRRDETAVLCLLLLRGPQTPGELRSRADRMFQFDDLQAVQATLDRLAAREEPIAAAMARTPGSREIRFRHLLGGAVVAEADAKTGPAQTDGSAIIADQTAAAGLADLRAQVQALEQRVQALEEAAAAPRTRPNIDRAE